LEFVEALNCSGKYFISDSVTWGAAIPSPQADVAFIASLMSLTSSVHAARSSFGIVIQALGELLSADATRETLAAGFVCQESHRIMGSFHHITRVIEEHGPTGSEEGAVRTDIGII
jgi:hypothetical protein|tara:strand:+ start:1186 stop:1533 length:348 start_codon:yes stop_codon:yes gene_type:complete